MGNKQSLTAKKYNTLSEIAANIVQIFLDEYLGDLIHERGKLLVDLDGKDKIEDSTITYIRNCKKI